jgi:hypothetical protein
MTLLLMPLSMTPLPMTPSIRAEPAS